MGTMTDTLQKTVTDKLYLCDGCPARAVTRISIYPAYVDLCNHHTNKMLAVHTDAEVLEDNRGNDYYKSY